MERATTGSTRTAAPTPLRRGGDHVYGGASPDNLYSGLGSDLAFSAGGDGYDTVQKGPDANLDRFVGCEKFGGWASDSG